MSDDHHKKPTRLVHVGRSSTRFGGLVNPPIERGSTVLTAHVSKLYGQPKSVYGRMGHSAHATLSEALCELENASHAQLAANGLNACALSLASVLSAGDHLIAADCIYGPTRRFCETYLSRMGIETTFVNPRSVDEFKSAIRSDTRAIFFELPGSLTFELTDIESIVSLAQSHRLTTIVDNTWGCGMFLRPLDFGVDMSVQALTKYVIGHSDGFGGAVMTKNPDLAHKLQSTAQDWGISLSPEDAYQAQRGIRSLALRTQAQGASSLKIAAFLEQHASVDRVLHPALPSHPDHEIWQKYYTGTAGLFSFICKPMTDHQQTVFFESLSLFGFGFSWGGFESLIIPCDPQLNRSCTPEWRASNRGPLIRVSVGLEDADDLIEDLDRALSIAFSA